MHRKLLGAASVVVVLVGCGGAERTRPASHPSLTRAQLSARADAICARVNERIQALAEAQPLDGRPGQGAAQRRAYAEQVATATRYLLQGVSALATLAPPAALSATFAHFVRARRGIAAGFPTRDELIEYQDPRAGQRDEERRRARDLAIKLGFTVCG